MPNIGDSAPNFTGHDFINNQTVNLNDYIGKVILLSFVARG
jgi:peroxiredoxin